MNKEIKLIFVTCFIYLLMKVFNLFILIETQFKNNIKISHLAKIVSIIIPVIIIMRYLNNTEGFKTQTISQEKLRLFINELRFINASFYDCNDTESIKCKLSFLEDIIIENEEHELKDEIISTLRSSRLNYCDINTKSVLFIIDILNIYSKCDEHPKCVNRIYKKIELYYHCIKDHFRPEDQKIITSFYDSVKPTNAKSLEEIECLLIEEEEEEEVEEEEEEKAGGTS